ncbi:hypothetical protein E2562_017317 [Oryza meyeriana var. granulata]|uniref:Uncharacterized protein n=1 Tax=Oryza meyeriana var. granulata TaxID=110450 RepID=A0A6G1EMA9_9ORYZ|nr:hypothetical protein E2562_017317 [Oryza meyeriana var. granulata]
MARAVLFVVLALSVAVARAGRVLEEGEEYYGFEEAPGLQPASSPWANDAVAAAGGRMNDR